MNAQVLLETETLIRNSKVIAEASYFDDRQLDFFGFNGTTTTFNRDIIQPDSRAFESQYYYALQRKLLRLRLDEQKKLGESRFHLLTGITFTHFSVAEAIDKRVDSDNHISPALDREPTLFGKFIDLGIIPSGEASGGSISLLSAGLIYDSRNDPCYCTDGKWFDAMLVYSPGFLSEAKFSKLIVTYRQHISLLYNRLTFSFRVSSQQKISGSIPFYMLPTFFDSRLSQDGVGGAYTLRGVMRNRIAADGFITGNFEIKAKIADFTFLKQQFSASIAWFYDHAFVTQTYPIDFDQMPQGEFNKFFTDSRQKLHHTFGPGVYLVFNKNNIITINYGISPDKRLGSGGLYIGSS